MKIPIHKYIFIVVILNIQTITAQKAGFDPSVLTGDERNNYSQYLWNNTDNSATIGGMSSPIGSSTKYLVTMTVEGSNAISQPTINKILLFPGTSQKHRFPNAVSYNSNTPKIDGYAIFEFKPVNGTTVSNSIPTGEPSIIIKTAIKGGDSSRYLNATNVVNNYFTVDLIKVTNHYQTSNGQSSTNYTYHYYDKSTISGHLTSELIIAKVDDVVVNHCNDQGTYCSVVYGNPAQATVRVLPGAVLSAVSDEFFFVPSNRQSNVETEYIKSQTTNFKLYPTSIINTLTIESASNKTYNIQVYDITNLKLIDIKAENNVTVDFSKLRTGYYVVKVGDDDKSETFKVHKN